MKSTKQLLIFGVLLTVSIMGFAFAKAKASADALVLYDDFKTEQIDPSKWVGVPTVISANVLEAVRHLTGEEEDRRLDLSARAYSGITNNSGTSGGVFGLSFINPSAISTVQFTLQVNKLTQVGCSSNQGQGGTIAVFRGAFFNVNQSAIDVSGDVTAFIGIGEGVQGNVLNVQTQVAEENKGIVLSSQLLGTVAEGSKNTLFLQWDKTNHQFIFQLNGGTKVSEPYFVSDTTPPFSPYRSLDVERQVANCTSAPRPFSFVDANFGEVFVNPSI